MGLPVLQGLPFLLRLVLQVVPLVQAAQSQAVEDVLVWLMDQLLEQTQCHDADLEAHMEKKMKRVHTLRFFFFFGPRPPGVWKREDYSSELA